MSSQQQLGLVAPLGEVDHIRTLSENLSSLLLNDSYQDITLVVENQRIPAHKVILAARSEYFRYVRSWFPTRNCCCDAGWFFRALLYGGLQESQQQEIELKDINPIAFKLLLMYIYTGCINLYNMKVNFCCLFNNTLATILNTHYSGGTHKRSTGIGSPVCFSWARTSNIRVFEINS